MKACTNITAEIFVVDNNSTDGSKEYLQTKFPGAIFRWNLSNDGYAKANNSVLGEAKGSHILLLNPDTIVPEDSFEKCLAFFATNNNCAALGVHMLDGSGKFLKESKRSFPSPVTSFFKMTGFASLFPSSKLFARYYAGHLNEKENNEVDVLAGAFMMIRREALNKLNGFDGDYFMYGEDIDLSYRLQKAGYKNYYFAGTSIIHFKGESTQKDSYNHIRTFYEAMKMFVAKHYKEKKGMVFLMQVSIGFGMLFATVKLFFKKIISSKPSSSKPMQVMVIAGQQRFDEMIHLLKYSEVPLVINGRIAVDKVDNGISIGRSEDITDLVKKKAIDKLVFCEGEISYRSIIEMAVQLAAKTGFLFHSKGSGSIVGSDNKNSKGFFIAKP